MYDLGSPLHWVRRAVASDAVLIDIRFEQAYADELV
jgi:hypothetical protein